MNKNKLRKIAILSALSTMLLSGCNKKNDINIDTYDNTETVVENITTQTTEIQELVSNQTIAKIYEEYKEKSNKDIDIKQLHIEEFNKPIYIWNTEGENYIYDYKINNIDYPGYTNIDPGYHGKMYAVILKNDDGSYEPISALANINKKIFNVKVNLYIDKTTYNTSSNYIIIDNPTIDDFNNMKNGQKYIDSDNKEAVISIDTNETNMLQLK